MNQQAMQTTDPNQEGGSLREAIKRRNIDDSTWRALTNSVFPGAKAASILLAADYCKSRGLDVMKKPCHIVPMKVKNADTGNYEWRDVILPGIYEYRTTAHRTGQYLGHSEPTFGDKITVKDNSGKDIEVPEWSRMTFYRWNPEAKQKVEFTVQTFFREVCATTRDNNGGEKLNARWSKAPVQMLTKCNEAAGLREAFPDELGGEPTVEEMRDNFIDGDYSVKEGDKSQAEKTQDLDKALGSTSQKKTEEPPQPQAEQPESNQASGDETTGPTYGEILEAIKNAQSTDEVDVAIDMARDLPENELEQIRGMANNKRTRLEESETAAAN